MKHVDESRAHFFFPNFLLHFVMVGSKISKLSMNGHGETLLQKTF